MQRSLNGQEKDGQTDAVGRLHVEEQRIVAVSLPSGCIIWMMREGWGRRLKSDPLNLQVAKLTGVNTVNGHHNKHHVVAGQYSFASYTRLAIAL